jgi:hypothetical protein
MSWFPTPSRTCADPIAITIATMPGKPTLTGRHSRTRLSYTINRGNRLKDASLAKAAAFTTHKQPVGNKPFAARTA